jgi:hypothetical protein
MDTNVFSLSPKAWTPNGARRHLPLFPTQEGGEGRGEEEFLFGIAPLSDSLPLVPHEEREEKDGFEPLVTGLRKDIISVSVSIGVHPWLNFDI